MDNILTINNQKPNVFEFQINVEGLNAAQADVRLVIDINDVHYTFKCKKVGDTEDKYSVTVPALKHIERTTYPCVIEVIIEDFYFEAMKGIVNVVGNAQITAQAVYDTPKPEAPIVTSIKQETKPNVTVTTVPTEKTTDDTSTKRLISLTNKPVDKKEIKKPTDKEIDAKVKAALKQANEVADKKEVKTEVPKKSVFQTSVKYKKEEPKKEEKKIDKDKDQKVKDMLKSSKDKKKGSVSVKKGKVVEV